MSSSRILISRAKKRKIISTIILTIIMIIILAIYDLQYIDRSSLLISKVNFFPSIHCDQSTVNNKSTNHYGQQQNQRVLISSIIDNNNSMTIKTESNILKKDKQKSIRTTIKPEVLKHHQEKRQLDDDSIDINDVNENYDYSGQKQHQSNSVCCLSHYQFASIIDFLI